jgi:hypothetical protein
MTPPQWPAATSPQGATPAARQSRFRGVRLDTPAFEAHWGFSHA